MAVNSLANALQPTGITGPPRIFVGRQTLLGDATGGLSTIRFQLPAGFLWMPRWCSANVITAHSAAVRMLDTSDIVGNSAITYQRQLTTIVASGSAPFVFNFPAMLVQTVRVICDIELVTANVDGDTNTFYLEALQWDKNTPPQAWAAFFTSPT